MTYLHRRKGAECDFFRGICEQGHYGGRTKPTNTRQGIYCATPSEKATCVLGEYCPANSTANDPCAAGFYCPTPSTQIECASGSYCEEGSTAESPCPAGSYCATPTQVQLCPEGSFCVEGSPQPTSCRVFSDCPAGSFSQPLNSHRLLATLTWSSFL